MPGTWLKPYEGKGALRGFLVSRVVFTSCGPADLAGSRSSVQSVCRSDILRMDWEPGRDSRTFAVYLQQELGILTEHRCRAELCVGVDEVGQSQTSHTKACSLSSETEGAVEAAAGSPVDVTGWNMVSSPARSRRARIRRN